MTLRRLLFLLYVVSSATVLAGCGGDAIALDPVASAASRTAESESARIALSATIDGGSAGTMTMTGRGLFDAAAKSGWVNVGFSLPQGTQLQLGGKAPTMEMIFDGRDGFVMYMRSPLFAQQLPSDKWVKVDMKKLADKHGVDLGSLMNANQADPNQTLRMLMASTDARVSGSDTIRGVRTTRYSFRVDLKQLAEGNDALRKMIQAVGIDSYPAHAWIDAQGRVRRLRIVMSMTTPQGAVSMTMTEDLYDFGTRAHVVIPSDGEVVDFTALTG